MLTIDALKEYGAKTEDGVVRCFGDNDFYLNLVKTVPDEPNFARLKEAVNSRNYEEGYEAAHALKGVVENLSLDPLSDPINEITNLMQNKSDSELEAVYNKIIEQRDKLAALIAD